MDVVSRTGRAPHAELTLRTQGNDHQVAADGDGPVDAVFKAIEKLAHSGASLQLYSVNAITTGSDSQGEVTVRLEKGGRIVNGQGADTDILVASAKAYLNAINLLETPDRVHPQRGV
jgi:2-isopropylmalate synthase